MTSVKYSCNNRELWVILYNLKIKISVIFWENHHCVVVYWHRPPNAHDPCASSDLCLVALIDNLKLAMLGIFTLQKSTNTDNQSSYASPRSG